MAQERVDSRAPVEAPRGAAPRAKEVGTAVGTAEEMSGQREAASVQSEAAKAAQPESAKSRQSAAAKTGRPEEATVAGTVEGQEEAKHLVPVQ